MSRQSTFSLLTIASLLSFSIALPFDIRPQNVRREAGISVVNVDGSSGPSSTASPTTVTQTVSAVFTQYGTYTPTSTRTVVATVNVDKGTATETVYVTMTPTTAPDSTSTTSTGLPPSIPTDFPPTMPFGHPPHVPPRNSTSVGAVIPLTTGTTSIPCDESSEDDGAPWRPHISTGTGTAVYPTGYIRPTGGYHAAVAPRPTDMAAPLPVLPPTKAPYWFNQTQVPAYRKRVVVS